MEACLIQHVRTMNRRAGEGDRLASLASAPMTKRLDAGCCAMSSLRVGFVTGETMVVLVTNGQRIPQVERWIERIRAGDAGGEEHCQNVNTKQTNVIFGDETRVLWGSEVIYDELDGDDSRFRRDRSIR